VIDRGIEKRQMAMPCWLASRQEEISEQCRAEWFVNWQNKRYLPLGISLHDTIIWCW